MNLVPWDQPGKRAAQVKRPRTTSASKRRDCPDKESSIIWGVSIKGGLIAVLKSDNGAQRHAIDASAALDGATQVIIWCKK